MDSSEEGGARTAHGVAEWHSSVRRMHGWMVGCVVSTLLLRMTAIMYKREA